MEWLGDHAWVLWIALAVVFGIVELTTLDLLFLMLAGGALAGGLVALTAVPAVGQVLVALAVSIALLGVVRPVALRHLRTPIETRTGVAALVGRQAVVVERIDRHGGRVKLGGEVWSARSFDPHHEIEYGQTVDVVEIEGATAVVYESEL
ncbi:MAG TPA: NfeD family protein [Actinomycetes bacterium]|nr:NfeD family protein [Actinomycetes bacterium]